MSGLRPSGGAGFIADVRVSQLLGARAVGSPTTLTQQNTQAMLSLTSRRCRCSRINFAHLLSDVQVSAIKSGRSETRRWRGRLGAPCELTSAPCVWDPVLAPSSGRAALLDVSDRDELDSVVAALLPHVSLVTPSAREASQLLGAAGVHTAEQALLELARALRKRGFPAVLLKGGDIARDANSGEVVDILVDSAGEDVLRNDRVGSESVHGTGCGLSTAIACALANGSDLRTAVTSASAFVRARVASPMRVGNGRDSLL